MPISFQPAAPFDAGLSAYGGAANATLQGNQLLAHAYASRAQANQQQAMAEMQLKAHAAGQNADLMQRDRQFDATLREKQDTRFAETGLAYDQMAFKGEAETAHLMAQQQQQQEHAQLDVWANSQKMSQVERVRLEQQKNGVGALKALYNDGKGSITKEDMYDGIAQLHTGINVGENRLKREQAEIIADAKNAQMEKTKVETEGLRRSQLARSADVNSLWNFVQDPSKRPAVEEEVTAYMPEVAAMKDAGGPAGLAARGMFEKEVARKMQSYGFGSRQTIDPKTGVPITHDEDTARIKAEAEAVKHATGPKPITPEEMTKHALAVAGIVSKAAEKAAEANQPWDAAKLKAENDKHMELFLDNLKKIQAAQAPVKEKATGEQDKLNVIEKAKTVMSGVTEGKGYVDPESKQLVGDRLIPILKGQIQKNLTEWMGLVNKYGTIEQVKSPEIKNRMLTLMEKNNSIALYGQKEAPVEKQPTYTGPDSFLGGSPSRSVGTEGNAPYPIGKITPISGNFGMYFRDERGRTFFKGDDGKYVLSAISRNR